MKSKLTWLEIGIDFCFLYWLLCINLLCASDQDSIPYWLSCIALGGYWAWTTVDYYRRRDQLLALIKQSNKH